ncbi:hypothetical protein [Desulfocurvus sp. DL9XJH121]
MRVVVPLALAPHEYLAAHPALLAELAARAVDAGQEVLRSMDAPGPVILAHDENRAALAKSLDKATAAPLAAPVRPAWENEDLLPPGCAEALAAAGAAEGPVLVLNPRAPEPDPQALATACRALADGDARVLFSARPPRDHPCQAKVLYRMDMTPQDAARTVLPEDQGRALATAAPCAPGTLLRLTLDGRAYWISPRRDRESQRTVFDLPPDLELRERSGRALVEPCPVPGDGVVRLPFSPALAPWRWDRMTNRVVQADTGRWIAGRQDFPEVLTPDRAFCLLPRGTGHHSEARAFAHAPAFATLIHDAFSALAWRVSTGRDQGPVA